MRQTFDERDATILQKRSADWDKTPGPRVGDFIQMQDGTERRLTHDWGEGIQTTTLKFDASFYLGRHGCVSFSGGLDPSIPKSSLEWTGRKKMGRFWFFHHDHRVAHNGVYFKSPCRVYRQTANGEKP